VDGWVSGRLSSSWLLILVGGSFDEFAVHEGGVGTDEARRGGVPSPSATGYGPTRSALNAIATPAARLPGPFGDALP
jgi:hypothetical protein